MHSCNEQVLKALLIASVVGAGGVEPPSSSVSANHREPLCYPPFSQVASDRRPGRETLSWRPAKRSLSPPLADGRGGGGMALAETRAGLNGWLHRVLGAAGPLPLEDRVHRRMAGRVAAAAHPLRPRLAEVLRAGPAGLLGHLLPGPATATVVTATVDWSVPLPAGSGCQRITQMTKRRLLPWVPVSGCRSAP
jgi:hypothetical protein